MFRYILLFVSALLLLTACGGNDGDQFWKEPGVGDVGEL